MQVCLDLYEAFGAADEIVRKQEEIKAELERLCAEEQRLMEVCAQEEAAKAAKSFAAVCRTPVVSSPPAPRKVATVAPAVKGAPPTLGTLADLENDYMEMCNGRWWGNVCMD
jgi:hypothetical protein